MLFKDNYFFLSNFYPCTVVIEIEGKTLSFKNSEAAYQAQKNYSLAEAFTLLSGAEAKKLGKDVPLTTQPWNSERLYAMANALHSKFKNPSLLYLLKKIEGEIVEDNYWNDIFWGVCNNKKYNNEGLNILGKMLMNIRDNNNDYYALLAYINKDLIKLCMKDN